MKKTLTKQQNYRARKKIKDYIKLTLEIAERFKHDKIESQALREIASELTLELMELERNKGE